MFRTVWQKIKYIFGVPAKATPTITTAGKQSTKVNTAVQCNGKMVLSVDGRSVVVYGGRYLARPLGMKSVKLAKEIDAACNAYLDIPDFGVPAEIYARAAVNTAINFLKEDGEIYVGCMGGIGRTGMFLAILVKRLEFLNGEKLSGEECIRRVRKEYLSYAIETGEQERFVSTFKADY